MTLLDHVTANMKLAEGFTIEAEHCGDERNQLLLTRIGMAHARAADLIIAEIASRAIDRAGVGEASG
jgi:hypothetical protein